MKIYVSRHKMTECPSCRSHIRVAADVADTACPFCGAVLAEQAARKGFAGRAMNAVTRGGLVAGALLGLSVMSGACEEAQPVYGVPADISDTVDGDAPADNGAPLYGLPADIQVDQAPEAGPQPDYGIPADE